MGIARRISRVLLGACVCAAPAGVAAEAPVDIRAFGDSAYIGGNGAYGPPPDGWVATQLKDVEVLRSADVNVLNLEASLTRSCERFYEKPFAFAVAPAALAQFGTWGFNLVGLANNHTLDCAEPAPWREIRPALLEVQAQVPGLAAHGMAISPRLLHRPAVLTVRGVRLGMVSIKGWGNGKRATITNLDNRAAILGGLAKAAVDVRILSLHAGVENSRRPTEEVMMLAREFVDAYKGDIVFAHHPHKSQGFEILTRRDGRTAVIFYSLGNGLHNGLSAAGDGLAAAVAVTKQGVVLSSLAVFPLARPSLKPRLLGPGELKKITAVLRDSSAAVALRPLRRGLQRVPFTLRPISTPAAGLRLALDGGKPYVREPASQPKSVTKALRRPTRTAVTAAAKRLPAKSRRPAAQWLPPTEALAH